MTTNPTQIFGPYVILEVNFDEFLVEIFYLVIFNVARNLDEKVVA